MPPDAWPHPTSRIVKAFVYVHDVAEDQGCTSVVRGSHRIPWGPGGVFDLKSAGFQGFEGSGSSRTSDLGFAPTGSIPNHVKFAARAGDCCIFDIATCEPFPLPGMYCALVRAWGLGLRVFLLVGGRAHGAAKHLGFRAGAGKPDTGLRHPARAADGWAEGHWHHAVQHVAKAHHSVRIFFPLCLDFRGHLLHV